MGAFNKETQAPDGLGIYADKVDKHRSIIIANWDNHGIKGHGIKLQNNDVAFCGQWVNSKYEGNCIYFWPD